MRGYDDGAVRAASVGRYEAHPWGLHMIYEREYQGVGSGLV